MGIYTPTRVEQPSGEKRITGFTLTKTTRAKVEMLRGLELQEAMQTTPRATIKITMRYTTGLTTDLKLVVDTVDYEIISIDNDTELDRKTVCMCVRMS